MTPTIARRTYLRTAGSCLALGTGAGIAGARGGADEFARQLNEVRRVTRPYRDPETARAAGYTPILGYFAGMGFHFAAPGGPLGVERADPPLLVYFTGGSYEPAPGDPHDPAHDDDLVLGGVEYLVPGDRSAAPPDIFADDSSARPLHVTDAAGWHFEPDLDVTGLHAWVHRGNPAGVFHPTNPTID